jgi:hypothetical protein
VARRTALVHPVAPYNSAKCAATNYSPESLWCVVCDREFGGPGRSF